MYPVIYDPPFFPPIYSFGTMMALGFMVAAYLTGKELQRKGLDPELASPMVFWAAIGGLVASRLWAIAENPGGLLTDPIGTIFTGSGFVWYGGLVGGTLGVSWVIHRYELSWLQAVDCIAPGLAIGQALGRIGCQLAGDGDWGAVTDVPWGMAYPNAIVQWPHPPGVYVHPTPLYEFAAYVVVFAILWRLRTRPHPDGTIFWWYLILAPGARFFVEIVRINRPVLLGLTAAQLFSIGLVTIGVLQLIRASRPVPARAPALGKR
jgi:phosphatidylglycerol:prolipoprotein diacylglycerol transferase